jgi:cation-transporting ATPase I
VVLDDRIETIMDEIVEGRAMWASVRDALAILVGGNLGEVGFVLAWTAIAGASPLGARQLLPVNLLTDMVPAMTMHRDLLPGAPPRSYSMRGPTPRLAAPWSARSPCAPPRRRGRCHPAVG